MSKELSIQQWLEQLEKAKKVIVCETEEGTSPSFMAFYYSHLLCYQDMPHENVVGITSTVREVKRERLARDADCVYCHRSLHEDYTSS